MEYQYGMPEVTKDFAAESSHAETIKEKMSELAHQKFPVKKYNEYTDQFVTIGEQMYEDALRDAYEELEHSLDAMISRIRDGLDISRQRMDDLQFKVNHFKTLLPT